MKSEVEITKRMNELIAEELDLAEQHEAFSDEFDNESDPVKQAIIMTEKILPLEIKTVLLMNTIDALNWTKSTDTPMSQEMHKTSLAATEGNMQSIQDDLEYVAETLKGFKVEESN